MKRPRYLWSAGLALVLAFKLGLVAYPWAHGLGFYDLLLNWFGVLSISILAWLAGREST